MVRRRELLWKWKKLKMKNQKKKMGARGENQMLRFRMAVLNVKGINQAAKRRIIEEWAEHKGVDIILLTETQHAHSSQEGADRMDRKSN